MTRRCASTSTPPATAPSPRSARGRRWRAGSSTSAARPAPWPRRSPPTTWRYRTRSTARASATSAGSACRPCSTTSGPCCWSGWTDARRRHDEFFVFADTVTAKSYSRQEEGQGWLGIRFQAQPRAPPSEIIIHARMWDQENARQQEALGVLGVNLIHGAFYDHERPRALIGVPHGRADPRPHGSGHDQVFRAGVRRSGQPAHEPPARPAAAHQRRPVLPGRRSGGAGGAPLPRAASSSSAGASAPSRASRLDMLERSLERMRGGAGHEGPRAGGAHGDDAAQPPRPRGAGRARGLPGPHGHAARPGQDGDGLQLLALSQRHRPTCAATRRSGSAWSSGVPTLAQIFEEKYYADLDGGVLEALGRLLAGPVRLYIYPVAGRAERRNRCTAETLQGAAPTCPTSTRTSWRTVTSRSLPASADVEIADAAPQVLAKAAGRATRVGEPWCRGSSGGHQGTRAFGYAAARLGPCHRGGNAAARSGRPAPVRSAYLPFLRIFGTFGARMRCTLGKPEPRSGRP